MLLKVAQLWSAIDGQRSESDAFHIVRCEISLAARQ